MKLTSVLRVVVYQYFVYQESREEERSLVFLCVRFDARVCGVCTYVHVLYGLSAYVAVPLRCLTSSACFADSAPYLSGCRVGISDFRRSECVCLSPGGRRRCGVLRTSARLLWYVYCVGISQGGGCAGSIICAYVVAWTEGGGLTWSWFVRRSEGRLQRPGFLPVVLA